MEKIINKNIIIGFVIGIIVMSGVGVVAATMYYSNQISYTPTDTSWNVDNVETALNELYDEINNKVSVIYLGTGTSFNIKTLLPDIDYTKLTIENFIVGGLSAPDMMTTNYTTGAGNVEDKAAARGFKIGKTYNASTGILSLSGASQRIQIHKNSTGYSSWAASNQNINCFAYLVIGNIESTS